MVKDCTQSVCLSLPDKLSDEFKFGALHIYIAAMNRKLGLKHAH